MKYIKNEFLLSDFVMNPLVGQSDYSPPAERQKTKCSQFKTHRHVFSFPQTHLPCLEATYQSMSLLSFVRTHASSNITREA